MEAAQEGHLELVKYLLAAGMCTVQILSHKHRGIDVLYNLEDT